MGMAGEQEQECDQDWENVDGYTGKRGREVPVVVAISSNGAQQVSNKEKFRKICDNRPVDPIISSLTSDWMGMKHNKIRQNGVAWEGEGRGELGTDLCAR